MSRQVVLHADDFGLNEPVTRGIIESFRQGLLTATSLLANAPMAGLALSEWKILSADRAAESLPSTQTRQRLGEASAPFELGIHLNLSQGRPLTSGYPVELLDSRGCFPGIGRLFWSLWRNPAKFSTPLLAELRAQTQVVTDSLGSPACLNGHQYVELIPAVSRLVPRLLEEFHIPAARVAYECRLPQLRAAGDVKRIALGLIKRGFAARYGRAAATWSIAPPTLYFGSVHAGEIGFDQVSAFLARAPGGKLELAWHPGLAASDTVTRDRTDPWHDPLAELRPREFAVLTSTRLVGIFERHAAQPGRFVDLP